MANAWLRRDITLKASVIHERLCLGHIHLHPLVVPDEAVLGDAKL